ncbi:MAG: hypothetical protein IIA02_04210 [Proteobacteria bacterium]|uniref:hypothetical protein n=1 Tax=Aquabacterium sp. TaxID=1872578 RepID=UPI0035C6EA1D|nr:hypothetical protein [Pseudomonadota bacterium]
MLFNPLHLARTAGLRHLVVWALLVALPVHSLSGVLQRVLGASHRHTLAVEGVAAPTLLDSLPTRLSSGLRHLVATAAGPGALALIDGDHIRALAQRQSAERQAHPERGLALFSASDLRLALAASPQAPSWQEPAADAPAPQVSAQAHGHPHAPAHPHAEGHHHDAFQRHLHDTHDASVVALGDKAHADAGTPGQASSADAGSGVFPLPAAVAALPQPPVASPSAWRHLGTQPWRSHVSGPLERPPQA